MSRRVVGFGFCVLALLLYSVPFIAIWVTAELRNSYPPGCFVNPVGPLVRHSLFPMSTLSPIALCVGIGYLLWAELPGRLPRRARRPPAVMDDQDSNRAK